MLVLSKDNVNEAVTIGDVVRVVEQAQEIFGRGLGVNSSICTLFENTAPEMLPDIHGNFQTFAGYLGGEINVEGVTSSTSCVLNPTKFGLPYAVGLQILNDVTTGMPFAIMERSRLTELVTPAVSAVGAKYLARKDARTVAIIGCGNQGRTHLHAFMEFFDIKTVKAFDIHKDVLKKYVEEMGEQTGITIELADSVEDAVRSSDISEIAINPTKPIVKYDWIKSGALLIALSGFGDELDKEDVYGKVDKIVMDCPDNWAISQGSMKIEDPLQLAKIVAGSQSGRENNTEKIVFVHSGMAINHVGAGTVVYKNALAKGLGHEVKLL
jgi:ornithine cyclodeaminase/alanine dehydrogenase-like protein (mu-crystallin family)